MVMNKHIKTGLHVSQVLVILIFVLTCRQREQGINPTSRGYKQYCDSITRFDSLAVAFMNTDSIKSFDYTSGEIKIHQFEFKPGMYLYSLIQDGIEIDTKRFILTNDN